METNYQITCKDWKTNDYPLHYEFRYQTEANDLAKLNTLPDEQEVTTLWYYGLEHTTPFSFLLWDMKQPITRCRYIFK